MAFLAGDVQSRAAVVVCLVDGGVRAKQQLSAFTVAFLAGDVQSRAAVVECLVDGCVGAKQQHHDLAVALIAGDDQRRAAVVVRLVNGSVGADQQPCALHLTKSAREQQAGVKVGRIRCRIGHTRSQEVRDFAVIALDNCIQERPPNVCSPTSERVALVQHHKPHRSLPGREVPAIGMRRRNGQGTPRALLAVGRRREPLCK